MELHYNKQHFQFSPPVQLLFHEQAKSIIALQELQNEVSHLLEFKNILLESYPHLQSKIKRSGDDSFPSTSNKASWSHFVEENVTSNRGGVGGSVEGNKPILEDRDRIIKSTPCCSSSSTSSSSSSHHHAYTTNISDSGFGNSADLKDQQPSSSSMNLFFNNNASNNSHFIVDELNHDELLLLLDVIHEKTMKLSSDRTSKRCCALRSHQSSNNPTLCNSSSSNPMPNLCSEIESLKREKESLMHKIIQLESQVKDKCKVASATTTTTTTSNDIVHSVQIRTSSSEQQQTQKQQKSNNSINIEIKGAPNTTSSKKTTTTTTPTLERKIDLDKKSSLNDVVNIFSSSNCKFTTSELNVSKKIGKTDKLDLSAPLQAIILLRGDNNKQKNYNSNLSSRVTREKIRKVLNINSVIELQRQLLATVMEKEVYKSHLEKLCDAWNKRIKEFEHQNESLQASLLNLKSENESLKSQVLFKRKHLNSKLNNHRFVSNSPLSWHVDEANNGVDEILSSQHIVSPGGTTTTTTTTTGDGIIQFHHQIAAHHIQPDSLLEEEIDSERRQSQHNMKPKNDEMFYDSISVLENRLLQHKHESSADSDVMKKQRKLIIPYNESFHYNSISNEDRMRKTLLRRDEDASSDISANASESSSGGLSSSKIPITEKLKKKILGW